MTVDPELNALLKQLEGFPHVWELPLEAMRKYMPEYDRLMGIEREDVGSVEDVLAKGRNSTDIPVRVYTPAGWNGRGTVVFYHGGGFVLGSIESYDGICRMIANASGCRVVAVEYRLAPENKFPAGVEDACDAFGWVCSNIPSEKYAVMGDSAGGNLAAAVSQQDRSGQRKVSYQVLIYPALLLGSIEPSLVENRNAAGLGEKDTKWFAGQYLRSASDSVNPLASPLLEADLTGLAPAMIVTAEMDPLRDQGEMYAERLREAGVSVVAARYSGMVHGFFNFMFSRSARSVLASVASLLKSEVGT